MTERLKFTVWRDRWLRGNGDGLLLNEHGNRCCLGFLGQACGLDDAQLLSCAMPSDTYRHEKWPAKLLKADTIETEDEDGYETERLEFSDASVSNAIATINDKTLTEQERETELTKLFASIDIDVEFKDGTGPVTEVREGG